MKDEDKEEALMSIVVHYGMPFLMELVDQIVGRISNGVMSVPLDKDPEKAALSLYSERMKSEGAVAVKQALNAKVEMIKAKYKESKR